MEPIHIAIDTWYRLADLLDTPAIRLRDGSSVLSGSARFRGSRLEALTGVTAPRRRRAEADASDHRYRYLQLTLQNVDGADLDCLPSHVAISSRLLRVNMLYLPDSSYAYDLLVRNGEATYLAEGAVCMTLVPNDSLRAPRDTGERLREVASAHRMGLLDDIGKSKADFRLQIKPTMRALSERLDSEYLSSEDCRADVVFAAWQERRTGQFVPTPLSTLEDVGSLQRLEIRLVQKARRRDFRLSDLFDERARGDHDG